MEEKSNSRQQWEKLKGQPFTEKLSYIFEYYGIYIGIGALVLVIIVVMFLTAGSSGKQHIVSGVLFNLNYEGSPAPIGDLICEKCGYDKEKCDAEFTTITLSDDDPAALYDQQEAVYARIVSGDLDFLCGEFILMENYLSKEKLDDCDVLILTEIFTPELIAKLDAAGRVLYYDTDFTGRVPFLIDISESYITEALDVKTKNYYMGFGCTTKRKKELTAMVEELVK